MCQEDMKGLWSLRGLRGDPRGACVEDLDGARGWMKIGFAPQISEESDEDVRLTSCTE